MRSESRHCSEAALEDCLTTASMSSPPFMPRAFRQLVEFGGIPATRPVGGYPEELARIAPNTITMSRVVAAIYGVAGLVDGSTGVA